MSRGVGHDQVTSRGPFKPLSPSRCSSGTWAEERTPTLLLSFSVASSRPCWFSSCMRKGEQGLRVCSPSPRGPGAPPHLPYAAGAPCCWPFVRSSAQNLCWLLHRSPEPLLPAGMGNHQIPCHRHTPPRTWRCPSFPCPSTHQPSAHPHPASGPARPLALCPARPALPGCPGHGGGGWRGGTRDLHYCAFLCLSLQEVCLGEKREQERLREGQGPNPSIADAISQSPPQPCRCPWLLGCTDPALAPRSLTLPGQASFSPVPSVPLPGWRLPPCLPSESAPAGEEERRSSHQGTGTFPRAHSPPHCPLPAPLGHCLCPRVPSPSQPCRHCGQTEGPPGPTADTVHTWTWS